jgi:hypothetical protein
VFEEVPWRKDLFVKVKTIPLPAAKPTSSAKVDMPTMSSL